MSAPTFQQAIQGSASAVNDDDFMEATDLLGDMGFAAAFPPVLELDVLGTKYKVRPLTNDDYGPWLIELWAEMKPRRLAAIPTTANSLERYQIATNIEETELTPDDFTRYVFRPSWTVRFGLRILEKAGVPEDAAKKWWASRPAKANEMFAVYFSGLYTTNQFNSIYERTTAGERKSTATTFGSVAGKGGSAPFPQPKAASADGSGLMEPVASGGESIGLLQDTVSSSLLEEKLEA